MRRRWIAGLLAVAGIVGVGASPAAPLALAETSEEFCTPRVINDYEAPLAALPKVREPPKSGRLPFGPRRLYFRAVADLGVASDVIVEGDGIEYRFGLDGSSFGPKRIGWEVESRLVLINATGKAIRVVRRKRERVGLLSVASGGEPAKPREIGFDESPVPGLYRYDLAFRGASAV